MSFKKRKRPVIPLVSVVGTPEIGRKYHVSWGLSHGVVGKCIQVIPEDQTVILQTPITKVNFKYPVRWSELRYIRSNEPGVK